ncbi:hypothetical protein HYT57_04760 [Candidatus Woesearchaeota archaeon]|nr:hypothetical protein [Candidatus Woesearchaeota archaeon]
MPKIQIRLTDEENKKANIVKSLKGYITKEDAIKLMIREYKLDKIKI